MIMWTGHPRLDWTGVLLSIVQSCARFSGSLMTLALLLCLCVEESQDFNQIMTEDIFIIRGDLYLTVYVVRR